MKGLLAVTWREIVQRRMLLLAALFASLVARAVPVVRGLSGIDAAAARHLTALILAAAFAGGTAIALGASMLAPAIASRRIAFDFARPLSAFAIWGGRFLAAFLLAVASSAIVWGLAGIGNATTLPVDLPEPIPVALALGVAALAVLLALLHATSIAILSRSGWIAIDVALAGGVWLVVSAALRQLPRYNEWWPLSVRLSFLAVVSLALIVAGYVSVARGRTDIRLAHRALSRALWIPVFAAALALYGYSRWVMAASPADITAVFNIRPAPAGSWVLVGGLARGVGASFLYDTESRRYRRLQDEESWPVFSQDGRRAAWVGGPYKKGPFTVWTQRLSDPKAKPVGTRLVLNEWPALLVLSADGSRLATVKQGLLSIHDLDASLTLVSVRAMAEDAYPRGFFVSPDRFRIYRFTQISKAEGRLEILELDVPTKKLEQTGSCTLELAWPHLAADPKGERLIVLDNQSKKAWLLDGRTGTQLATLAEALPNKNRWTGFLADGRPVLTDSSSDGKVLRVFTRDGSPAKEFAFPGAAGLALGGEVAPGELIVAIGEGPLRQVEVIDVDNGERRRIGEDLFPAAQLSTFWNQPTEAPAVGSPATTLFSREFEFLVRIDPATGKTETLLGKRIAR